MATTLFWTRCLSSALLSIASATAAGAGEPPFRPLFDGKSLEGWSAPDMRYWSVADGAITARSSAEIPCTENQFLVWRLGEVDDFDLRLKFRIQGGADANSGVQIRSRILPDGHAAGYQADIDRAGQWLGALYDEHERRGSLARRGERTEISASGERSTRPIDMQGFRFDADGWNDYEISARGAKITLRINGVVTCEVVDEEPAERDAVGRLALQLHSGPPATVQFRDIQLRRLPLETGRKVVLVAGHPSHGPGEHEFNAGVSLLARRLRKVPGIVVAEHHDAGWPKDPSVLDNAHALAVYSDGGGGHLVLPHLDEIDAFASRGGGILCMHYAVEVPAGRAGDAFKRWIGGYYEHKFSSNPHWDAELRTGPEHPIARGVEGTTVRDEWYFSIRFREDETGIIPILLATPSDATRSRNGWPPEPYPHIVAASGKVETLMWAVERPDGGRGVGFTGGHFHRNWAYDTQRRAILNALLWVAGAEVPAGGVDSDPVTEAELNEGLDPKGNARRIEVPEAAR